MPELNGKLVVSHSLPSISYLLTRIGIAPNTPLRITPLRDPHLKKSKQFKQPFTLHFIEEFLNVSSAILGQLDKCSTSLSAQRVQFQLATFLHIVNLPLITLLKKARIEIATPRPTKYRISMSPCESVLNCSKSSSCLDACFSKTIVAYSARHRQVMHPTHPWPFDSESLFISTSW